MGLPLDRDKLRAFHAAHFDDPSRRTWFAEQIALHQIPATPAETASAPTSLHVREDMWTSLTDGEDEATWQARHGVRYLTPGAARIFDTSRRYREQRMSMH